MYKILFSLLIFSFSALQGVLPPLYSTANEIKAILNSPELSEHLTSADAILAIEKTDNGWFIKGFHHSVTVEVVYLKQDHPGPAKYNLVWHAN
ncbi:MAG: hypothetical protein WC222_02465 [Parachlamydiales bacterium]